MWRNVDNALSMRVCTSKLYRDPVDNDCGQMCTILRGDEKNWGVLDPFEWHNFTSFWRVIWARFSTLASNPFSSRFCGPSLSRTQSFPHEMWTRC
jgi:hypothetical protein